MGFHKGFADSSHGRAQFPKELQNIHGSQVGLKNAFRFN